MSTRRWLGWLLPALVMVVGVGLVATTFADDLFDVGPAFEEMIDDFRPLLEDEALAQASADLAGLEQVRAEFETGAIPSLSEGLGMAPGEFAAYLGDAFPAVATGVDSLPEIGDQFTGLVGLLAEQQPLFRSADEIPTADLPATAVPWGILLAGLAALAIGGVMLQARRLGAWLAVAFGVVLVGASLLLSLPGKSADADDLNDNLEPVYTVATVQDAQEALSTVSMMGTQLETELLPALATQLEISPEQLGEQIAADFPAMAGVLDSMPDTLGRFGTFVETFNDNLDNYATLRPVEFTPIIWTVIVAGLVVLVAGAAALWRRKVTGEPAAAVENRVSVGV